MYKILLEIEVIWKGLIQTLCSRNWQLEGLQGVMLERI